MADRGVEGNEEIDNLTAAELCAANFEYDPSASTAKATAPLSGAEQSDTPRPPEKHSTVTEIVEESSKKPESSNLKTEKLESSGPRHSGDTAVVSADPEYAEHITYKDDGSAIYTDPSTSYKYKWSSVENNWLPCAAEGIGTSSDTATENNPYETEHYKWCTTTKQWQPKKQSQTENEHYKWDDTKKEWIPKTQTLAAVDIKPPKTYDVDEQGQRIYTDKDGAVYFWDVERKAWFPRINDDFMALYQMNYGFIDNTSASEEEKKLKEEQEAKRKEQELLRMSEEAKAGAIAAAEAAAAGKIGSSAEGVKRKPPQEQPKWFDLDPVYNTKVYVSNLPLDITYDEFSELMGKCGMIMRDPQTQKFKLKLYTEADGQIKGDGLCDYIKVESVDLALEILDEYNLRGNKISVQRAKFQMRGEYNPALKPKRKKKDKEKLLKMKEKLFDWRPERMRGERTKNEKIVIIKNLFQPETFEKQVELILEYQNDLREECLKCGTVRKVVIYDRHPEGVAQVNMASPEEADVVIQMMQGRFFGKRQLSATHWDGQTKYKVAETKTDEQQRLSEWDQFLEAEEKDEQNGAEKEEKNEKKDDMEEPKSDRDKDKTIEEKINDIAEEIIKETIDEQEDENIAENKDAKIKEKTDEDIDDTIRRKTDTDVVKNTEQIIDQEYDETRGEDK